MARYAHEGNTRVSWVTTIADISGPTVAELNAGTNITGFITKDGVNPGLSPNMVDSATIEDIFDAQGVGSYGASFTLTMFRDAATDTAWDLCVYGTSGYLAVRRGVPSATAWTAAQDAEIYPAQMHEPLPEPSAANEQVKFTDQLAITDAPDLKAVVAA